MPNISAHMIVACEVGKKLNIFSDDYIRGNLLPDVIDVQDSHHKVRNGTYLVPDIDYFVRNLDLSQDLDLGYMTHLLLDKHYLQDYIEQIYPNQDVFSDKKIYQDYNCINCELVSRFNLDVDLIEQKLNSFDSNTLKEKLNYNIECLKQKTVGKTKYLDVDNFSEFLKNISEKISFELAGYILENENSGQVENAGEDELEII